jgi:hypothetical protein
MANPVAPVPLMPGIQPVPLNQTSYAQYYQDESHDKAHGNYAAIMGTFIVPIAGKEPTPVQVLEAVNASAVADLQAFVTLVVDRYFPKG